MKLAQTKSNPEQNPQNYKIGGKKQGEELLSNQQDH